MQYFEKVTQHISKLATQQNAIADAARIVVDTIKNDGIVHSFGSGHSNMLSLEISRRAGGLVPILSIEEPSQGQYERVEGVGYEFWRRLDVQKEDAFIIISNSGRNALPVELAEKVKANSLPLIVVTALEFSKSQTSRLKSGKKLYEYADVILDNMVPPGDGSVQLEGAMAAIGPLSTIAGSLLLNQMVVLAVEMMLAEGIEPPILRSANVDGGREHNEEILSRYYSRLRENIVI